MMQTPFFTAWRHFLAPLGTAKGVQRARAYTLCQLENCFAPWVPRDLFPKATEKLNSRDRDYSRWHTFWCMLWQGLNPAASGREVVRQLQALFDLEDRRQISPEDGAYCRAKARLPLEQFPKALAATARTAEQLSGRPRPLQGRPVKVADGSTLTLQETPKNRAAYPSIPSGQTPTFPQLRLVVLFSLLSGAVLAVAEGAWGVSELALLHALARHLTAGDILLGDRGLGSFPVIAWLKHSIGVDFIGRTTRRIDGRARLKRLGRNDWLLNWKETPSCCSPWLSASEREDLPAQMILRAIKGSCHRKGFRVRQVTVVTTLLDCDRYPASEILQAYLRRWRLEMCLDDLKTSLGMEFMRARSPQMINREIYTRLIAHNLIRCTMAQAALEYGVALDRVSFKGSLDALRHFTHALARAGSKAKRRRLWQLLLQTLARDPVPERPGRREPRAIKRQKHKYPKLNLSRRKFKDRPKRTVRRKNARLRKLGLM